MNELNAEIVVANNLSVLRRLVKRQDSAIMGVEYEAVEWAIRVLLGTEALCLHADKYPRGSVKALARRIRELMREKF